MKFSIKNTLHLLLNILSVLVPFIIFFPIIFEYVGRIIGQVNQPIMNLWLDIIIMAFVAFSLFIGGFGLYRFFVKKPISLWYSLGVVVIIFGAIVWNILFGWRNQLCTEYDSFVAETASVFQEYHNEWQTFPDVYGGSDCEEQKTCAFMPRIIKEHKIDFFSSAGPDELFVYFKSNCKLRIMPDSYEVYPIR